MGSSSFFSGTDPYEQIDPGAIEAFKDEAEAAAVAAEASKVASQGFATASQTSATHSANSAADADASADAAATSAAAALSSQTAAAGSASSASTSASAAAASNTSAAGHDSAAAASAAAAAASQTAAASSASAAATSETNAASSASAANTSKLSAAASEVNSAASASAANASKIAAATSETNAASSASAASTSATNAGNSATAANNSKVAAATSETNAASSASTASTAATTATNKLATFLGTYYGAFASDPTLDPNGAAPTDGDLYTNITTGLKAYFSGAWQSYSAVSVATVFGRSGSVVSANGDYTASQITNVPAGTIAAVTVQAALNELDSEKQAVSAKGNANGYASLDASGKVPNAQLPALAITDVYTVASQAAMLALSTAEQGDVAIRTDLNKSFILSTSSYSTLADWKELLTPTDAVLSVAGLTGAVSAGSLKTALSLTKSDVGLSNVDNTADSAKPVSTATQTALNAKSDIVRTAGQSVTGSTTLVLGDAGCLIFSNSGSAHNITVPPNSSVAFPVRTQIDFIVSGAGLPSFVAGAGVTLLSKNSNKKISAQNSAASLVKSATDTWYIIGDLTA